MGDLNIGKNGENLEKFKNLKDADIKENDIQNKEIFSVFEGAAGDQKLDKTEMNNIFEKLKKCDTDNDGQVTAQELRKSTFFQELKKMHPHITAQKVLDFAQEVMGKLDIKLNKQQQQEQEAEEQKANQANVQKQADLAAAKTNATEYIKKITDQNTKELNYPEGANDGEKQAIKKAVEELQNAIKGDDTDSINKKQDAVEQQFNAVQERLNEEKKQEPKVQTYEHNVQKETTKKISYQVREGGVVWKGATVKETINLNEFKNAQAVLDKLLEMRNVKNLTYAGKKALLDDFIKNNPSVFNSNGDIHNKADISKLELPQDLKCYKQETVPGVKKPQTTNGESGAVVQNEDANKAETNGTKVITQEEVEEAKKKAEEIRNAINGKYTIPSRIPTNKAVDLIKRMQPNELAALVKADTEILDLIFEKLSLDNLKQAFIPAPMDPAKFKTAEDVRKYVEEQIEGYTVGEKPVTKNQDVNKTITQEEVKEVKKKAEEIRNAINGKYTIPSRIPTNKAVDLIKRMQPNELAALVKADPEILDLIFQKLSLYDLKQAFIPAPMDPAKFKTAEDVRKYVEEQIEGYTVE